MKFRPRLRNENINYSYGWFFVTIQAAFNKTIFGAIVGEECVLNELGMAVTEVIGNLGRYYVGTHVDCFVVMPNHIHLILKIEDREGNRKHQLGYVVGRFKSYVAKLYRDMKATGRVVDVGDSPWQRDYWEKIITDHDLKNAAEVWAGAITPGHTLASLVSALAPREAKSCGGRPPACESQEN